MDHESRQQDFSPSIATALGLGPAPRPFDDSRWREIQHRRRLLLLLSNQNIGVRNLPSSDTLPNSSGFHFGRSPNIGSSDGHAHGLACHPYQQQNSHGLSPMESDIKSHAFAQNIDSECNAASFANLRQRLSLGHSIAGQFDDSDYHGALGKANEARLFPEPSMNARMARMGGIYDNHIAALRDRQLTQARLMSSLLPTTAAAPQLSFEAQRIRSAVIPSYDMYYHQNPNSSGKVESSSYHSSPGSKSKPESTGTVDISVALEKLKKPSRPLTSYNIFFKEIRRSITEEKAAGDGMSFTEMGKQIGARWKALADDEKGPYLEKAKNEKSRHKGEMKEYNRKREEIMSSYHSTHLRSVNEDVMNRYYQEHGGNSKSQPKKKRRRRKDKMIICRRESTREGD